MKFVAIAALVATTQAAVGVVDSGATTCDGTVTVDADITTQNDICVAALATGACCISADTADATNVGKCTTAAGAGDGETTLTCLMIAGASKLALGAAVLATALYM